MKFNTHRSSGCKNILHILYKEVFVFVYEKKTTF